MPIQAPDFVTRPELRGGSNGSQLVFEFVDASGPKVVADRGIHHPFIHTKVYPLSSNSTGGLIDIYRTEFGEGTPLAATEALHPRCTHDPVYLLQSTTP